jgi:hypothetical protein
MLIRGPMFKLPHPPFTSRTSRIFVFRRMRSFVLAGTIPVELLNVISDVVGYCDHDSMLLWSLAVVDANVVFKNEVLTN